LNFDEILSEELFLNEEKGYINPKHNSLLLLDIDDTLLKPQNIYIYRKLPTDKTEVKLTPEQYAKEKVTPETKKYYDYRDFRDPNRVYNSIKTGLPIIPNLNTMDNYIKNGWKIGILTARGLEDVVGKGIKDFLKYKDKKGNLKNIGNKLARKLIFAVNDERKNYKGNVDFEKKSNVMLDLLKNYDRVWLLDDDDKNINAINKLREKLRNTGDLKAGKIRAIKAK